MTPTLRAALLASVLTALALLAGAQPAAGHDTLVSSDPADSARLATAPAQLRLTFDQPVRRGFSTVTVTGPGNTRWEAGEPAVSGSSVIAPIRPLGPAGEYVVAYRILSADGHPLTGSLRFTLTTAGTGTPAEPAPGTAGGQGEDGSGWPWVATAVLLTGAGALLAGLLVRRLIRRPLRPARRPAREASGEAQTSADVQSGQ